MSDSDQAPAGRLAAGLVLLPALLAPAAVLLARAWQARPLLPALATLAVYPAMAALILRGRRAAAVASTLLWAISLSASIIAASRDDASAMSGVVFNGPEYRDEMFAFIRTGEGRESDPARFIPQHLLHFAVFALLAAGSGGLLGILLGSVLVAYMSFYVGALAAAGGAPTVALLFGWAPWAILRVAGFVIAGIGLSEPLLFAAYRRTGRRTAPRASFRPFAIAACVLLVADVTLKLFLASAWAGLLRPCLPP